MDIVPPFAPIPRWCSLTGMSRTGTYVALGRGYLRAIKCGNRTLIDVHAGLDWLHSLPQAEIRLPAKTAANSEGISPRSLEQRSIGLPPMDLPRAADDNGPRAPSPRRCAPPPSRRRAR
jgi:hypothetical protein